MPDQTALPASPDAWTVEALRAFAARELGAGPDEFGTGENLIELGLNSLSLIKLPALLAQQGIDVSFSDLAASPSVDGWFALIRRAAAAPAPPGDGAGGDGAEDADAGGDPHAPFPLTDIQRAYWLGRDPHFELGGVAAHGYIEVEAAELDPGRLEEALNATIRANPMLRAVIGADGTQRVLATVPRLAIPCADLRALPDGARAERIAALREGMEQAILPADRWPLFDIRLTRLTDTGWLLHIGFDILLFDLKSLEIWVDQWWRQYDGTATDGPPQGTGFRAYVRERERLAASPQAARARHYWEERAATLPLGPQLPLARAVETLTPPRFARVQTVLPAGDWQRLRERAHARGLTGSALLMAAYAATLARWSSERRFTLTTTLFDRASPTLDLERVIGDFTSLVLLEVDAAPGAPFEALAHAVQRQLWRDLDHSLVSGVEALAKVAAARNAPNRALMPFVFTSALGTGRSYLDAVARFGRIVRAAVQTPQTLIDHQALECGGDLVLNWDHVADAFPDGLVALIADTHLATLRALADGDAAWTGRHDRLPAAQVRRRAAINATAWTPPGGFRRLHDPFLDQARRRPEAVALRDGARALTYAQLDAASDRLAGRIAGRIAERGVAADELVAVLLPRGWEQVAAVLAILKAGAAYLPIDPALPAGRIATLLEQGGARLALVPPADGKGSDGKEPAGSGPTLLPVGGELLSGGPPAPFRDPAGPGDLAYVIFTSGSTGTPKGVMIEHRAALNTILDVNARHGIGPGDVCLMVSSLGFDLSVYDIFGTLAAGGTLVVPPSSPAPEPAAWRRLVREHGVTLWNSVPALLQLFHDHLDDAGAAGELNALRTILLSGDWLPLPLCRRLRALPGVERLVALGGATEAAIWSIAHPVEAVAPDWRSVPYGRPLANQTVHVLDAALEPCPDWVAGEIHIGGAGLARGYWRDAARTADRFLVHPATGERLYRTGDWGRWHPDGHVEFLGRRDTQVKINGLRVELGEIEAGLARLPGVRQAAVVALRGSHPVTGGRGDRLAGFVAVPDSGGFSEREALDRLREVLPPALVPTTLDALDALPLTANGKIDRAALEARARAAPPATAAGPRRPLSEPEERIAALWSELLGVPVVETDRSFFALGGNSLLATRLAGRLSRSFGQPVPVIRLFEHQTVARQARLFAKAEEDREADQQATAAGQRRAMTRQRARRRAGMAGAPERRSES
ncbi:amino acid adenylation domain-containing protein [Azospirillum agricola]|uniref:non-ribosomal peptide synthetase n=1 Tax=Azospirillum agricola TaxID=1720247 RepID=UPI001AE2DDC5|nr:non-ribosomal peptide synthetase [Azospirillum agricola]MBP2231640.1 amino acid adenylation domain-containing protein [Azospirillum agricola]